MVAKKKSMIGHDPLAWLEDKDNITAYNNKKNYKLSDNKLIDKDENYLIKKSICLIENNIEDIALSFYDYINDKVKNIKDDNKTELFLSFLNCLKENLDDMNLSNEYHDKKVNHKYAYDFQNEIPKLLIICKKYIGRSWTKKINNKWEESSKIISKLLYSSFYDEISENQANPVLMEGQLTMSDSILKLKNVQDISKAQDLKDCMLSMIKTSKSIQIDASSVDRIDGSSLQLLCGLFEYGRINNIDIDWLDKTNVIEDSAKYIGVEDILKLA